jgi:hypothetical protein
MSHDPFYNEVAATTYYETYLAPKMTARKAGDRRLERDIEISREIFQAQRQEAWMERNGLRESGGRYKCLAKVAKPGHSCNTWKWQGHFCSHASALLGEDLPGYSLRHHWHDHIFFFYHPASKGYVLTSQPYDLTVEVFDLLQQRLAHGGIDVRLEMDSAWWYPGHTPLLSFWRRTPNGEV